MSYEHYQTFNFNQWIDAISVHTTPLGNRLALMEGW